MSGKTELENAGEIGLPPCASLFLSTQPSAGKDGGRVNLSPLNNKFRSDKATTKLLHFIGQVLSNSHNFAVLARDGAPDKRASEQRTPSHGTVNPPRISGNLVQGEAGLALSLT